MYFLHRILFTTHSKEQMKDVTKYEIDENERNAGRK